MKRAERTVPPAPPPALIMKNQKKILLALFLIAVVVSGAVIYWQTLCRDEYQNVIDNMVTYMNDGAGLTSIQEIEKKGFVDISDTLLEENKTIQGFFRLATAGEKNGYLGTVGLNNNNIIAAIYFYDNAYDVVRCSEFNLTTKSAVLDLWYGKEPRITQSREANCAHAVLIGVKDQIHPSVDSIPANREVYSYRRSHGDG